MNNNSAFHFRWLGAAGLEFSNNGYTLLIDPYLSRLSLFQVLFGKAKPDEHKILSTITAANAILVTHGHYDHLMDIPAIAKKFNCPVYGSRETCFLLKSCGVEKHDIHEVAPGDKMDVGPFSVRVMKSSHPDSVIYKLFAHTKTAASPRRAFDFGMDSHFSYQIAMGSLTCLTDPGKETVKDVVDILFINTFQGLRIVRHCLKTANPSVVVPIHWDNFFKPISGSRGAPGWGLLPVKRVFLRSLQKLVRALTFRGRVFLPHPFKYYSVEDILQHDHE
jgi:hypothetical protein